MPREMRRETLVDLRLWAPALLNFPSGFQSLARRSWVPQGMLPEFWRSISWPPWFEVLVVSLVIAFCAALCVGLLLDASFRDELIYP